MLKQHLQLKLSQKLSPQQIQLMKLIQLPTLAFEQKMKEEMNENPALEPDEEYHAEEFESEEYDDSYDNDKIETEDKINIDEYLSDDETPYYKLQANNYSDDDKDAEMPIVAQSSFRQDLLNQINTLILTDLQYQIAEFIVGSIDDSGYLRDKDSSIDDINNRSHIIEKLVDDLAFIEMLVVESSEVEEVLQLIQELDPAGVGARDLQECLLLQLKRKTPTEYVLRAMDIVENKFEFFTKKHYDKLLQKYNITREELQRTIEEIEKLNPKPGDSFVGNAHPIDYIIPDFTIKVVDGELELTLNSRNAPSLKVSRDYQEMLQSYKNSDGKSNKEAVTFIKQKLDSAKWFIDAIRQRQETLLITMQAIMHYQEEYFLEGDETKLKPMILKDIADMIGFDISTVSRVASSKYVETPYGIKLLKDLFSESMKNDQGEDVSTIEIKKVLKKIIEEENKQKPYSDDKLASILKEKGYPIARRTVAKYRELEGIPVASLRKKIL